MRRLQLTTITIVSLVVPPAWRRKIENFPPRERGTHISRADNENDIDRVANSTLPPKIENFQARSRTKENGADIENMARSRAPVANVSLRAQTRTDA